MKFASVSKSFSSLPKVCQKEISLFFSLY